MLATALATTFVVVEQSVCATVLKGRIEQIYGTNDPKMPELKSLAPKFDTSQEPNRALGKISASSASTNSHTLAEQQALPESYPIDWKGNWSGELTIMDSRYLEPADQSMRAEIDLERRANAAGRKGKAVFSFRQVPPSKVSLEPVEIKFVYPSNMKLPDAVSLSASDAAKFVQPGERTDDVTIIPDRTYYISMNNVKGGITVGGNIVTQRVMRNTVSSLAKNVIEEDIVTLSSESLRGSQRVIECYNEDVLRFTMINQSTILVQAVTLAYNDAGHCDTRVSFAGYVQRH